MKPDQSDAEEGWLGGEINGKEGWFPAAYAEEIPLAPTVNGSHMPGATGTGDMFSSDTVREQPASTESGIKDGFANDFSPTVK